jgi:hypothetical protein
MPTRHHALALEISSVVHATVSPRALRTSSSLCVKNPSSPHRAAKIGAP